MPARSAATAALLAAAAVAGGCGDEQAAKDAGAVRTQAEQATGDVSPEARDLLGRAEQLAGQASAAGRDYASGDLAPDAAATRFGEVSKRAEELKGEAEALPDGDRAREQLTTLTEKTRSTADELREAAEAGPAPDAGAVEDRLRGLQDESKAALDRYRDQLPADVRDEVEGALDQLSTP